MDPQTATFYINASMLEEDMNQYQEEPEKVSSPIKSIFDLSVNESTGDMKDSSPLKHLSQSIVLSSYQWFGPHAVDPTNRLFEHDSFQDIQYEEDKDDTSIFYNELYPHEPSFIDLDEEPQISDEISNVEKNFNEHQSETQSKKKVGRRPLGLGLTGRKDVAYKTVLRKIKSFFWKEFCRTTGYVSSPRCKDSEAFYKCIHEFINSQLNLSVSEQLVFALASFMCPDEYIKILSQPQTAKKAKPVKDSKIKNIISSIKSIKSSLYQFNEKKLKSFILKKKDMCRLILHYYNRDCKAGETNDECIIGKQLVSQCTLSLL